MKEVENIKQILKTLMIILLLLGISLAGYFLFLAVKEQYPYMESEQLYDKIRTENTDIPEDSEDEDEEENTENASESNTVSSTSEAHTINFNSLRTQYGDNLIAWIYVPGTRINYPVMKGQNDSYYLDHTPENKYNKLGSIFVPAVTSSDLSDAHTIFYGHNMASGRMFGNLSNYTSSSFRNKYPYVYIYTPNKTLTCLIYNAYTCKATDGIAYKLGLELGTDEYSEWQLATLNPSTYGKQITDLTTNAQIMTLSTCTDSGSAKNRFIVHCIVISENEN